MTNNGKYLPTYKGCVVCGEKEINPHTLHLRFMITSEGVETVFVSDKNQEGYKGVVHGGIVASILDETIGWSIAVAREKYFMTVELNTQFLKPLPVGKKVVVKGWPVEHKRRSAIGEGIVQDDDGIIYAKARVKFFLVSDEKAKLIHDYLTFKEDDFEVWKDPHE